MNNMSRGKQPVVCGPQDANPAIEHCMQELIQTPYYSATMDYNDNYIKLYRAPDKTDNSNSASGQ